MDGSRLEGGSPNICLIDAWFWEFILKNTTGPDVLPLVSQHISGNGFPGDIQRLQQMFALRELTNMAQDEDSPFVVETAINWLEGLQLSLVEKERVNEQESRWGMGLSHRSLDVGILREPILDLRSQIMALRAPNGATVDATGEIRSLMLEFTESVWGLFGPLALEKIVAEFVSRGGVSSATPGALEDYDSPTCKLSRFEAGVEEMRRQHDNLLKLLDEQKEMCQTVLAKLPNARAPSMLSDKMLQLTRSQSQVMSFGNNPSESGGSKSMRGGLSGSPEFGWSSASKPPLHEQQQKKKKQSVDVDSGDDGDMMIVDVATGPPRQHNLVPVTRRSKYRPSSKGADQVAPAKTKEFTVKEDRCLEKGLEKHGKDNFDKILSEYQYALSGRSVRDLQERIWASKEGSSLNIVWKALQ